MRRGHPAAGARRPPLAVRRCPSDPQPPGARRGLGGRRGAGPHPLLLRGGGGREPPRRRGCFPVEGAGGSGGPGEAAWGAGPAAEARAGTLFVLLVLVPVAGGSGGRAPTAPNEGYRLAGGRSPAPVSRGGPCEIRGSQGVSMATLCMWEGHMWGCPREKAALG
uniref:Uncharacterized protein n=1 Tax=Anser brachyrhynchus TaxID=132585 RepID=A0A8B9C3C8_9AVES